MTENLQLLMYGGEKEDHFYNYNLADASNIPEIKNGYYYFMIDMQTAKILKMTRIYLEVPSIFL